MYQVQLIIQFLISLTVALVTAAAETTKPNKPEATPIYIDRIPGYEDLKPCAVIPLSTLVRNMWGGCGDGSQLTSYSCFCTDSYSRFSWQISTAVVENCGSGEETLATSAVEVFRSYCTYGSQQLTDPRYAVTPSTTSSAGSSTLSTTATTTPAILPSQTAASLLGKTHSSSGARVIPLVATAALAVSLGCLIVV